MKDRLWIVLVLALIAGLLAGWWGKGRWAEHVCAQRGGLWFEHASACAQVAVRKPA
ncbi:MAG: hypothetical protein OC190_05380 [Novosphingobium aromaticivorans]|jgi:hypothetical protein|nr:hypothetical protein [Novosphingobium aromaticivorans]